LFVSLVNIQLGIALPFAGFVAMWFPFTSLFPYLFKSRKSQLLPVALLCLVLLVSLFQCCWLVLVQSLFDISTTSMFWWQFLNPGKTKSRLD
jgi:hypothetical protein